MRNNPITPDFTKKFRYEHIAYPGRAEKQYSDFLFRQFAGCRKETAIIDISLAEKLSDKKIISGLFEKMRGKDLPGFAQLLSFMQWLQKKVNSYAKKEPSTSQYYRQLLPALKECISLVNSYHEQIQKNLVNKLRNHICNKPISDCRMHINSGDIDTILSGIDRYSRPLHKYFAHFSSLLQRESDNSHRISVTSRIEQCLLQLVNFIEKVILDTTETSHQLEKWQMKLIRRETQELYN